MSIKIIKENIATLKVDAIVNAANKSLLGGGGVDGAIHRAAGPKLIEACRMLNGCEVGEAKITPGFNLPAKWIIHTVGPVWNGGTHNEEALLKQCYISTLQLAKSHSIRNIAFPAISTGAYRFPKQSAAQIALATVKPFENDFDEIILCVFSDDDLAIYQFISSS